MPRRASLGRALAGQHGPRRGLLSPCAPVPDVATALRTPGQAREWMGTNVFPVTLPLRKLVRSTAGTGDCPGGRPLCAVPVVKAALVLGHLPSNMIFPWRRDWGNRTLVSGCSLWLSAHTGQGKRRTSVPAVWGQEVQSSSGSEGEWGQS